MSECNIIVITPSNEIKQINIYDTELDIDNFNIDDILHHINRITVDSRGIGTIERECDFETHSYTFSVFGWTEGSIININPYTFIYPIDSVQFFGNIFVILWNEKGIINLTLDTYNDFITNFKEETY